MGAAELASGSWVTSATGSEASRRWLAVVDVEAVPEACRSGRRRWVVGECMTVMMTTGAHQNPHHWKKSEKSSISNESPGQDGADRNRGKNPCSEGSSLSS